MKRVNRSQVIYPTISLIVLLGLIVGEPNDPTLVMLGFLIGYWAGKGQIPRPSGDWPPKLTLRKEKARDL